jgi:hypothetical protein
VKPKSWGGAHALARRGHPLPHRGLARDAGAAAARPPGATRTPGVRRGEERGAGFKISDALSYWKAAG